jgi:hypothetical protein
VLFVTDCRGVFFVGPSGRLVAACGFAASAEVTCKAASLLGGMMASLLLPDLPRCRSEVVHAFRDDYSSFMHALDFVLCIQEQRR